ncbi:NmrA family NAD(P)-binding protein [Nannocystis radixulma]|uniref:NmrA family NAD(P)-binding protein n=1 Tax=Nannocystis radixulma TaxID=2995305 RepID=A0ABT5BFX5_9BACT|nr:NmrA family NAD(P)-binding protein [Nannocystis radixulma]MDC0673044.1 NmrA family NAD(P)-binding protein [Nannocystis radixulma]
MHVIFGSTGTVGSAVVDALVARGRPTRAVHHSRPPSPRAREHARVDLATGDGLAAALDGAETVFLATGDMVDQIGAELRVVDAARRAGVRRLVKLSLLAADSDAFHLARVHHAIERALADSGLAHTILRPGGFMQNFLTQYAPAIRHGCLRLPFAGAAEAVIDARDIAAVAVVCLEGDAFAGRTLDLFGPESLTYAEMTAILAAAIGRPVAYEPCSDAEFHAAIAPYCVTPAHAQGLVDLLRFHREGRGPAPRPTVLEVTGQPARSFAAFAREHAAAWRA